MTRGQHSRLRSGRSGFSDELLYRGVSDRSVAHVQHDSIPANGGGGFFANRWRDISTGRDLVMVKAMQEMAKEESGAWVPSILCG